MLTSRPWLVFFLILFLMIVSLIIAMPSELPLHFSAFGRTFNIEAGVPEGHISVFGRTITIPKSELKQGLDIQGGMQVVMEADMSKIPPEKRVEALKATQDVVGQRVDLFGINESVIQTSQLGDQYRISVELAGVKDPQQALQLIGKTAQLDFRLEGSSSAGVNKTITASDSPEVVARTFYDQYKPTGLTGEQLSRSKVEFERTTNKPQISLEFTGNGKDIFSDLTTKNVGKRLGIFMDDIPIALPTINQPINTGTAVISGEFTLDEAKQLAIELTSGSLPVPLKVVEQRVIGAGLGQDSIQKTVKAGILGLGLVMIFMVLNYGFRGVIAVLALTLYGIFTVAIYKVIGVTLTVPGIAGLLLSIGMAVDSNILIFERMKEELRLGRPFKQAMERGFGRAWNSIKDANIVTILVSLILINPLNFAFLNTSGLVKGFGVTLLIGIFISLFTGIVVSRNFMRLFLRDPNDV